MFINGKVEVGGGAGFGPEFDASLDVLLGIVESEPYERFRIKLEVAVRLLRANYTLTDDQLSELLVVEPGDSVSDARFSAISNIVTGQPPKPLADTSDAPPL